MNIFLVAQSSIGSRMLLTTLIAGTMVLTAHDLQVCKASDAAGPVTGSFLFSVTGQSNFSLTPGQCRTFAAVGSSPLTITELTAAVVTGIAVTGGINTSTNTSTRTAILTVPESSTVTVTFTNVKVVTGRFTGGGSITPERRITHGFELHCDASEVPNNLEINNGGDNFHLETLTSAVCSISAAGVATIRGTGTGSFNGLSGYTISFVLTDAGEPGTNDFASYTVTSPSGAIVTSVSASGNLNFGNQQFHEN